MDGSGLAESGHRGDHGADLLWAIVDHNRMSALRQKADIRVTHRHVRFRPIADMLPTNNPITLRQVNLSLVLDKRELALAAGRPDLPDIAKSMRNDAEADNGRHQLDRLVARRKSTTRLQPKDAQGVPAKECCLLFTRQLQARQPSKAFRRT